MNSKGATFVIILILVLAAAFYWQQENEPVTQTPNIFSIPLGSWGHCENHDGSKSWKPRADGKCYAVDAPSEIGDTLRQVFDDHPNPANPIPQIQVPPVPRSIGFCLTTEDIPGVDHQNFYNIREWGPRSDGLCYPQDAPVQVTTSVYGDHFRGGPLGCTISFFRIWSPRTDGMCWAEDAPN